MIVRAEYSGTNNKPDHVFRQRFVCGLTVIWRLHPTDSGNWNDGWFYNPDDGKTYRTAAELRFDDMLGAVAWRKPQIVRLWCNSAASPSSSALTD